MGLKFAKGNRLLKDEILDFYIPNATCQDGICEGATDLCKKYCYGNGVFRHSTDPHKKKLSTEIIAIENYEITKTIEFSNEMCKLIEEVSEKRKKKNRKLKWIRIHSIGDFYDYSYFLKWIEIINRNPDINFIAYVKNYDVLKEYKDNKGEVPGNFRVLLSIYPDTYDRYEADGGKAYVDDLLEQLQRYYKAKKYIVCSREYFYQEITKKNPDKVFCNGGTKMVCKYYGLDARKFMKLFVPGQGCNECMKCYTSDKCKSGSSIYAVLRASGNLANLQTFLKKSDKTKYKKLREMYSKEI